MALTIHDVVKNIGSILPARFMDLKHTSHLIQIMTQAIDKIETSIQSIMEQCQSPITSIPGINYRMSTMILAEVEDYSRFDNSDQILAFAGLSPSTYQSRQLDSTHAHMEKCGSHYL